MRNGLGTEWVTPGLEPHALYSLTKFKITGGRRAPKEGKMERKLMVKQLVGKIQIKYGLAHLYESGEPGWVVIRPLLPSGCEGGLEFAYKRTDFKPGALRKALRV